MWNFLSNLFTEAVDFVLDDPMEFVGEVAGPIASAYITSDANKDAARRMAEAEAERTRVIQSGNEAAQARYEADRALTEPAIRYLKGVIASDPMQLTPQQTQQLGDTRLQTQRNLNASGLRGAGRSQVAATRAVESDLRNRFLTENTNRQDIAARSLADPYFQTTRNLASLDTSSGSVAGDATLRTGASGASADLANVGLRGRAIGDISSYLSSEIKDRTRESRYRDRLRDSTTATV